MEFLCKNNITNNTTNITKKTCQHISLNKPYTIEAGAQIEITH